MGMGATPPEDQSPTGQATWPCHWLALILAEGKSGWEASSPRWGLSCPCLENKLRVKRDLIHVIHANIAIPCGVSPVRNSPPAADRN
eukprot:CAMPEP_0194763080 /NCGR_PEP_ID=MMETSP0323_2-20130528/17938_1 /TAXON_ID=2866 ORGANISM="Crypthecodinium cohnii, Strain Seligo" /NCGR_SAMPLE_ID=MMETSP0323_2 /ASSEMBLY_ACC=CAM_ASM_000346 /LENGTH=86 /DNA_ID=CAMNT_0039687039 /DNA_START=28 /DNA_END=289 /DNA_ORIENTATION=-